MIELDHITKKFVRAGRSFSALKDVSIKVENGSAVAIVGESGAGKTTLMNVVLDLIQPTTGTYWFDGVDVRTMKGVARDHWRKQVQAVFQNSLNALNPRLKVSTLVTEPLHLSNAFWKSKERDERAAELLATVGLPGDLVRRFPHQLSGGQRQRVAIARALGVNPKVLVLDEPVSALDVSVRAQVLNVLRDLREELGLTYLYITHDLTSVEYLCDSAFVMRRGEVVEHLDTRGGISNVTHPYTEELLRAVPSLPAGNRSPLT